MRRPRKESGASLDSLLDTMTNVVGILVILLTITQLGVGDAVKRIGETDSVKPEVYDAARQKLLDVMTRRIELEKQLEAFQPAEDEEKDIDLLKLKKQIQDFEADLAVLLEGKEEKDLKEAELRRRQQEAQRKLDQQKKEEAEMLAKLTAADQEKDDLRARLAKAPATGPVGPKVITLPNPRPAPKGSQPVTVLCRQGRAYLVDENVIQEKAFKRATSIIARRKLGRDPRVGIDPKVLTEEFNRQPIKTDQFEVQLTVAGRVPKLVFHRRDTAGETAQTLRGGKSQFERRVRRIEKRRFYARFLVWPDSFDTYLEARRICSECGMLAGWKPQTTQAEYTVNLAGKILLGPPPKPKPKPPPGKKPPKPPPKKPPRKPLPENVID